MLREVYSMSPFKRIKSSDYYISPQSKVYTRTPTMYLDFKLQPGVQHVQPVPSGNRGHMYISKTYISFTVLSISWFMFLSFCSSIVSGSFFNPENTASTAMCIVEVTFHTHWGCDYWGFNSPVKWSYHRKTSSTLAMKCSADMQVIFSVWQAGLLSSTLYRDPFTLVTFILFLSDLWSRLYAIVKLCCNICS